MSDEDRAKRRASLADARKAAPSAASLDEIKERNRKALEKRKAEAAKRKAEEATKPLPEGWRRVESRSRPGEFVYENIHTEERQAWFPETVAVEEVSAPLVAASADDASKAAIKEKNRIALEKRRASLKAQRQAEQTLELPEGWKRVESRSRPGEMVYENQVSGERQAWFPDAPAVDEKAAKKKELMDKNKAALAAFKAKQDAKKADDNTKPLPDGWKRVESRSRPGEFVYENEYTEERQAWFPEEPAEKPLPEGWRKVESRSYPGEFVYENINTLERQAWRPDEEAPLFDNKQAPEERTKQQLAEADKKPARNIVCKAKAVYDYAAQNTDEEIDLIEGDVVAVEYKAANGWWVGTNMRTNRNGIFPGTFVEEIK